MVTPYGSRTTPLQGKTESRQSLFDDIERVTLQILPAVPYELRWFREAKVHPNCHVKLSEDKHYYSVPYKHVGLFRFVILSRQLKSMLIISVLLSMSVSLPKMVTLP